MSVSSVKSLFPKRIKVFRQRENLTQKDFAARIGVSEQTVVRWEGGTSQPALDAIQRITDEFPETNLDWLLLGREGDVERSTVVLTPPAEALLTAMETSLEGVGDEKTRSSRLPGAVMMGEVFAKEIGLPKLERFFFDLGTELLRQHRYAFGRAALDSEGEPGVAPPNPTTDPTEEE